MCQEAIQDRVEFFQCFEMDLEDEAILAGYPMAFDNLRHPPRQLGDFCQFARHRTDADESGDGKAECQRIDIETITADNAGFLQPLHALAHGGRRHADTPGERGYANSRIVTEETQQFDIATVPQNVG